MQINNNHILARWSFTYYHSKIGFYWVLLSSYMSMLSFVFAYGVSWKVFALVTIWWENLDVGTLLVDYYNGPRSSPWVNYVKFFPLKAF